MKILNCIVDDKFIDCFIDVLEVAKDIHTIEYVIFSEQSEGSYKYIHKKQYVKRVLWKDCVQYVNNGNYDLIILHSLSSFPLLKISEIKSSCKILWKAWGFDIYRTPDGISPFIPLKRLQPISKRFWKQNCRNERINILKMFIYNLLHRKQIKRSVQRIDYFSGCLPSEYELMKRNPFFKAKHLLFDYFYLNSDYCKEKLYDFPVLGANILVGNSAGILNNHLDILEQLKNITPNDKKIILPLSYGGNKPYIDYIKHYGQKIWNEKFISVETFMPRNEYFELIESCGYAIFGYERQAALGNVFHTFWIGAKVFLSETSINYQYFKQNNFIVYSIQHDLTKEHLNTPLTKEEILVNRKAFLKVMSVEVSFQRIVTLFKTVEKDICNN